MKFVLKESDIFKILNAFLMLFLGKYFVYINDM